MVIPVSAHRCQLLALFLGLSLLVHKAASSTPGIAYEPLVGDRRNEQEERAWAAFE
jgi:hypothetical protein